MSVEIEAIQKTHNFKEDVKESDYKDAFAMLSTVDPETGLDYSWLEIRERLSNGEQPINILPYIFDYYQEKNCYMDAWSNYLLACSHFDPIDLGGPKNRSARKLLELKVKKLVKARAKDTHSNIHQFMFKNRDI